MPISKASFLLLALSLFALLPASAYHSGDFPGTGSYSDWQQYAVPSFQQARDLRNEGKYDDAIAKVNKAISIYPYDAAFFQELGYEYEARAGAGDLQQAEDAYEQATRLNADDWSTWRDQGYALIKLNRNHEAVEALQHALQCNPSGRDAGALKDKIQQLESKSSAN